MAAEAKAPSLAEEYSLPPQEAPVEKAVDDKPQEAESIPVTNDETPQADEVAPAVKVNSETSEVQDAADKSEAVETNPAGDETNPAAEESNPATDSNSVAEETNHAAEETTETSEEKSEIKIETAPADFRFPTTNQTRHCFTRYVEYHRCVAAKGEDAPECDKFAKYYRSLCPGEWVERWNEQRENGTFPGPLLGQRGKATSPRVCLPLPCRLPIWSVRRHDRTATRPAGRTRVAYARGRTPRHFFSNGSDAEASERKGESPSQSLAADADADADRSPPPAPPRPQIISLSGFSYQPAAPAPAPVVAAPAPAPAVAAPAEKASPAKGDVSKQIPAGIQGSRTNNNYHRSDGQNTGNFLTDRPSTKVHAAPGGGSSLGYLFGGN
ncbi:hypothetical protein GUJ93_ZPchr0013g37415 [Zizania palustris]|uniref:Cytochrome c oxidase subunit 6b-1 n=1 Tax=Zizania palustris TaxID=103762 RepID=A0A8J6BZI7_ZIZPA|nr:hypothetical protein GUJ93_ZPchr0013g37415 [Zizania palustris]